MSIGQDRRGVLQKRVSPASSSCMRASDLEQLLVIPTYSTVLLLLDSQVRTVRDRGPIQLIRRWLASIDSYWTSGQAALLESTATSDSIQGGVSDHDTIDVGYRVLIARYQLGT